MWGGNLNQASNTFGCGLIANYGSYEVHTEGGSGGSTRICLEGYEGWLWAGLDLLNAGQVGVKGTGAVSWNILPTTSCAGSATAVLLDSNSAWNHVQAHSNGSCGATLVTDNGAGNTVFDDAASAHKFGTRVLTTPPSSTAAGFNLPHGSAPTSPVNGDIWTTSSGLYARINGSTVGPLGSGGGDDNGTINASSQYSLPYYSASGAATSLSGIAPPTTKGNYSFGYKLNSDAAAAPVVSQIGLTARAVTGATSTDTILYSDNTSVVTYEGSVAVAVTLPTPATLENSAFTTVLANQTSGAGTAVTVTPATWTINGMPNLVIALGSRCTIYVDAGVANNWASYCSSGAAVTSVAMTGDGTVFSSTVTGSPVTSAGTLAPTLATQSANTFLAGPTSGSAAAPTFRAITAADLGTPTNPYCDPLDTTCAAFNEEFLSGMGASSTTGGYVVFSTPWELRFGCGTSGGQSWGLLGGSADLGAAQLIGCTTAAANDTLAAHVSSGATGAWPAFGNTANWRAAMRVQIDGTTSEAFRVGFCTSGTTASALCAGSSSNSVDIRYDTSQADTGFYGEMCNSSGCTATASALCPADTSAHTFVMYSTSAHTVNFSCDGGTAYSVSANYPTGSVVPTLWHQTLAAAPHTTKIYFFKLKQWGLAR